MASTQPACAVMASPPRSPPPVAEGDDYRDTPEAAVRHDPADQVGEGASAGADEARAYRDFWTDVGLTFPDLHGARSTAQYLEDEQWLFQTHLAPLEGLRILKTDLWDEAKNTRILGWAAAAGSRAFGVDISPGIVRGARRNFEERSLTLHGVQSDVRALPFLSGSFDAIYSMGTVEHFADTDGAVREIFRVVRTGWPRGHRGAESLGPLPAPAPGGAAVPARAVWVRLREVVFAAHLPADAHAGGFKVTAETGILFIPGWLRMLDLACYTWARPLSRLTGLAVAPFHHLSRWLPWLRRYGYLLATVAVRPAAAGAPSPQRCHDHGPADTPTRSAAVVRGAPLRADGRGVVCRPVRADAARLGGTPDPPALRPAPGTCGRSADRGADRRGLRRCEL